LTPPGIVSPRLVQTPASAQTDAAQVLRARIMLLVQDGGDARSPITVRFEPALADQAGVQVMETV
jgi:hypothetical protein